MTEETKSFMTQAPTAKETAVFEAVLGLLSDGRQFHELTISEIAAKAGIGKGTVYEYFDSKETIFARTLYYCMQNEQRRAEQLLHDAENFQSAVFAVFDLVRETLNNPLSSFRLLFAGIASTEHRQSPSDRVCYDNQAYMHRQVGFFLDMGRAEGLIGSSIDNETGSLALKAAIAAFVAPAPDQNSPAHRDKVYGLLLKMLA